MNTLAIVLPTIVLAFAVGLFVTTEGTPTALFAAPAADVQNVGFMGHVEFVHKNADGYVISYYQTDNQVMDDGKDCVAVRTFDAANALAASDCTSSAEFQFIALGDRSCGTATTCEDGARTSMDQEMTAARRADTAIAGFTSAADPAGTIVVINTEVPFNIGPGNNTNNIFEAGLFDVITVSGGNVFAIRNTTSTSPNPGIDVNNGDTLDVTWTITVG